MSNRVRGSGREVPGHLEDTSVRSSALDSLIPGWLGGSAQGDPKTKERRHIGGRLGGSMRAEGIIHPEGWRTHIIRRWGKSSEKGRFVYLLDSREKQCNLLGGYSAGWTAGERSFCLNLYRVTGERGVEVEKTLYCWDVSGGGG